MPNLTLGLLAPAVSLTLISGLGLPAVVSSDPPTQAGTVSTTTSGDTEAVAPTGEDEESISFTEIDPEALPLEAQPEASAPVSLESVEASPEDTSEPSDSASGPSESPEPEPGEASPTEEAVAEEAPSSEAENTDDALTGDDATDGATTETTEEESAPLPEPQSAMAPETTESAPAPAPATVDERDATEEELAETALPDEQEQLAALTVPTETIDFIAAGLTWNASTSENVVEASVRVREGDQWSDWNDLEIHPIDRESGVSVTKQGTEPLITNGANAIQARVLTESGNVPGGLEVTVIDPGESPTDGQLDPASPALEEEPVDADLTSSAKPSSSAASAPIRLASSISPAASETRAIQTSSNANVLKPAIVTRSQWGANESWAVDSAQSPKLDAMYIHHTAGTNNYSASQAYQQIRAIYSYHARTLDWGDIGYQFLVDRFGTIYEGRRGALTSLPIGAQAGGFNTNTIGISAIGDFDVAQPPAAMVEALQKVLAWQGYRHGLKANSNTQLTSRAAPGSSARYPSGTKVTVPVILGHRDTNATACPGRYLYPKLSSMRSTVAQRIATAEREHGSGTETYPEFWLNDTVEVKHRNIRTSGTIGWIGRGEAVRQIERRLSWSYVQTPIGVGWIPAVYLQSSKTSTGPVTSTRYTKASTPMRTGANSKFSIRTRAAANARVEVHAQAASWLYVSTNSRAGWIPASSVHPQRWASSTMLVRRGPHSTQPSLGRIGRGESVAVLSTGKSWTEVITPIGRGYMPTGQISTSKVSPGPVLRNRTTTQSTPLRVGAHSTFAMRGRVPSSESVKVHLVTTSWSYVSTSVGNGWVATAHLK